MSVDFLKALDFVLSNEDYPQTDPRFGLVHVDNNGANVRMGLNEQYDDDGLVAAGYYSDTMSVADALALAKRFYHAHYWASILGDSFADQSVVSKVFDMAVNEG